MEDGTKLCCWSILVLIALVLIVIYPLQIFLVIGILVAIWLVYLIISEVSRKIRTRELAEKKMKRIYKIVKNTDDKRFELHFAKAIKLFDKGKFDECLDQLGYTERLIRDYERELFEKEQNTKGLFHYKGIQGRQRWGTPEQIKEWKEIDIGLSDNFAKTSPSEFESFVAGLFERMGYRTHDIRHVGDYGVDIIAEKGKQRIAIQVKRNSEDNRVGNRTVQQILGAMLTEGCTRAIVVTTSYFTRQAIEQAGRHHKIELWDKDKLHDMVRKYFIGK